MTSPAVLSSRDRLVAAMGAHAASAAARRCKLEEAFHNLRALHARVRPKMQTLAALPRYGGMRQTVAELDAHVADAAALFRAALADHDARTAAKAEELTGALVLAERLRDLQRDVLVSIAGRLVRREFEEAKRLRRTEDLETAEARIERFYGRWLDDAMEELGPFLTIGPDAAGRDIRATALLATWSRDAMRSCLAVVRSGGDRDELVRRWAGDHNESALANALLELWWA